jgi:hypothetical protein
MMAYRQDSVERTCAICAKSIEKDDWMLDLFREQSALENSGVVVEWVHARCARRAIEVWLTKRRAKIPDSSPALQ